MPRGAMLEADPELFRMMSPEQRRATRRVGREQRREERMRPPAPEGLAEEKRLLTAVTERHRIEDLINNFDREFVIGSGGTKSEIQRARRASSSHTPARGSMERPGRRAA